MEIKQSNDGKVIPKNKITITEDGNSKAEQPITDSMKMLVSAMIKKDGKAFTRVSFLRGSDWAEGIVPDAVIEKSEGFTEKELEQLKNYLAGEKDMILEQAKGVNPIKNMFF